MSMRQFTRLTNAFSKKVDNHMLALALRFAFYNFCRIQKSLKNFPGHGGGDIAERFEARQAKPTR